MAEETKVPDTATDPVADKGPKRKLKAPLRDISKASGVTSETHGKIGRDFRPGPMYDDRKWGKNFKGFQPGYHNPEYYAARNQSILDTLGNAVVKTVGNVGLDLTELTGYVGTALSDVIQGHTDAYADLSNSLSDWSYLQRDKLEGAFPTYNTPQSEGFAPWNPRYWAQNGPSIASFISIALATRGVGTAVGLGARGIARGAGILSKYIGSANRIGKAARLAGRTASKIGKITGMGTQVGGYVVSTLGHATLSRYLENMMEANGVRQQLLAEGYTEEEANYGAVRQFRAGDLMLVSDLLGYGLLFRRGLRGARRKLNSRSRGKSANPTGAPMSKLQKAKGGFRNWLKESVYQMPGEAAEEIYQTISAEEAMLVARGQEKPGLLFAQNFQNRFYDYATNHEVWTSALLGAVGAGVIKPATDAGEFMVNGAVEGIGKLFGKRNSKANIINDEVEKQMLYANLQEKFTKGQQDYKETADFYAAAMNYASQGRMDDFETIMRAAQQQYKDENPELHERANEWLKMMEQFEDIYNETWDNRASQYQRSRLGRWEEIQDNHRELFLADVNAQFTLKMNNDFAKKFDAEFNEVFGSMSELGATPDSLQPEDLEFLKSIYGLQTAITLGQIGVISPEAMNDIIEEVMPAINEGMTERDIDGLENLIGDWLPKRKTTSDDNLVNIAASWVKSKADIRAAKNTLDKLKTNKGQIEILTEINEWNKEKKKLQEEFLSWDIGEGVVMGNEKELWKLKVHNSKTGTFALEREGTGGGKLPGGANTALTEREMSAFLASKTVSDARKISIANKIIENNGTEKGLDVNEVKIYKALKADIDALVQKNRMDNNGKGYTRLEIANLMNNKVWETKNSFEYRKKLRDRYVAERRTKILAEIAELRRAIQELQEELAEKVNRGEQVTEQETTQLKNLNEELRIKQEELMNVEKEVDEMFERRYGSNSNANAGPGTTNPGAGQQQSQQGNVLQLGPGEQQPGGGEQGGGQAGGQGGGQRGGQGGGQEGGGQEGGGGGGEVTFKPFSDLTKEEKDALVEQVKQEITSSGQGGLIARQTGQESLSDEQWAIRTDHVNSIAQYMGDQYQVVQNDNTVYIRQLPPADDNNNDDFNNLGNPSQDSLKKKLKPEKRYNEDADTGISYETASLRVNSLTGYVSKEAKNPDEKLQNRTYTWITRNKMAGQGYGIRVVKVANIDRSLNSWGARIFNNSNYFKQKYKNGNYKIGNHTGAMMGIIVNNEGKPIDKDGNVISEDDINAKGLALWIPAHISETQRKKRRYKDLDSTHEDTKAGETFDMWNYMDRKGLEELVDSNPDEGVFLAVAGKANMGLSFTNKSRPVKNLLINPSNYSIEIVGNTGEVIEDGIVRIYEPGKILIRDKVSNNVFYAGVKKLGQPEIDTVLALMDQMNKHGGWYGTTIAVGGETMRASTVMGNYLHTGIKTEKNMGGDIYAPKGIEPGYVMLKGYPPGYKGDVKVKISDLVGPQREMFKLWLSERYHNVQRHLLENNKAFTYVQWNKENSQFDAYYRRGSAGLGMSYQDFLMDENLGILRTNLNPPGPEEYDGSKYSETVWRPYLIYDIDTVSVGSVPKAGSTSKVQGEVQYKPGSRSTKNARQEKIEKVKARIGTIIKELAGIYPDDKKLIQDMKNQLINYDSWEQMLSSMTDKKNLPKVGFGLGKSTMALKIGNFYIYTVGDKTLISAPGELPKILKEVVKDTKNNRYDTITEDIDLGSTGVYDFNLLEFPYKRALMEAGYYPGMKTIYSDDNAMLFSLLVQELKNAPGVKIVTKFEETSTPTPIDEVENDISEDDLKLLTSDATSDAVARTALEKRIALEFHKTQLKTELLPPRMRSVVEKNKDFFSKLAFNVHRSSNKRRYRMTTGPVEHMTQQELEQETAWIKENLPQFSVDFVNLMSQKDVGGRKLHGMFTSNAKILVDKLAATGTVYHEAYHGVSLALLSPKQRDVLYNEVRSKMWAREFTVYDNGKRVTVKGKDLSDRQAEEVLAEMFREYMMTDDIAVELKRTKTWFSRLIDTIRKWLGIERVEIVFQNIRTGQYAHHNIRKDNVWMDHTRMTDQTSLKNDIAFHNQIVQGVHGEFMTYIKGSGMESRLLNADVTPQELKQVYEKIRKEVIYDQLIEPLEADLNELREVWPEVKQALSNPDMTKLHAHPAVIEYKELSQKLEDARWMYDNFYKSDGGYSIIDAHWDHLRKFGIEITEAEVMEQDAKADPDNDWALIKIKTSPKASASKVVKFYLSGVKMKEEVINTAGAVEVHTSYNDLGFVRLASYGQIFKQLSNGLAGSTDLEDMLPKLSKLIDKTKNRYHWSDVLEPFGFIYGEKAHADYTTDPTVFDNRMQFLTAFVKTEVQYRKNIRFSENEPYRNVAVNMMNSLGEIINDWQNLFVQNPQGTSIKLAATFINKFGALPMAEFETGVRALSDAGIATTGLSAIPNNTEEKKKALDVMNRVLANIIQGNTPWDINEKGELKTNDIKALAEFELENRITHRHEDRVTTLMGESMYPITTHNFVTRTIDKLNNTLKALRGNNKFNPMYMQDALRRELGHIGMPYATNSRVLRIASSEIYTPEQNIITFQVQQGNTDSRNWIKKEWGNMTNEERIMQTIYDTVNGMYHFIRVSDNPIERTFSINDGNNEHRVLIDRSVVSNPMAQLDIISSYIEDEIRAIHQAYIENPEIYANYKTYNALAGRDITKMGVLMNLLTKDGNEARSMTIDKITTDIFTLAENTHDFEGALRNFINEIGVPDSSMFNFATIVNQAILDSASDIHNLLTAYKGFEDNVIFPKELLQIASESNNPMYLAQYVAWNWFASQQEQFKLFFGHPSQYKNMDTLIKRISGAFGPKNFVANDIKTRDFLKTVHKLRGDTAMRSLVVRDFQVASRQSVVSIKDEFFNTLEKHLIERYGAKYGKAKADLYRKIDSTDGHALITLPAYKEFMIRSGNWDYKREAAYQYQMQGGYKQGYVTISEDNPYKEIRGKTYTRQELERNGFLLNQFKPQGFGPLEGSNIFQLYKLSVTPLLPELVEGNEILEDMASALEGNQADVVMFESSAKLTGRVDINNRVQDIYDDEGNVRTKGLEYERMPWEYFGIQVANSPNSKPTSNDGVQQMNLIFDGDYQRGMPVDWIERFSKQEGPEAKAESIVEKAHPDFVRRMADYADIKDLELNNKDKMSVVVKVGKSEYQKTVGIKEQYETLTELTDKTQKLKECLGSGGSPKR